MRKYSIDIVVSDDLKLSLEHIVEALQNGMIGKSYPTGEDTLTFIDRIDPISSGVLGEWGGIVIQGTRDD